MSARSMEMITGLSATLRPFPSVGYTSAMCGEDEAVEALVAPAVVRGVGVGRAEHVGAVVVASDQALRVDVVGLHAVVGGDAIGEGHLQAPPGLAALLPRVELDGGEGPGLGEGERLGEVGPHRVAARSRPRAAGPTGSAWCGRPKEARGFGALLDQPGRPRSRWRRARACRWQGKRSGSANGAMVADCRFGVSAASVVIEDAGLALDAPSHTARGDLRGQPVERAPAVEVAIRGNTVSSRSDVDVADAVLVMMMVLLCV